MLVLITDIVAQVDTNPQGLTQTGLKKFLLVLLLVSYGLLLFLPLSSLASSPFPPFLSFPFLSYPLLVNKFYCLDTRGPILQRYCGMMQLVQIFLPCEQALSRYKSKEKGVYKLTIK